MAKQNVNLLMECDRRFSQKPWYSLNWLNAMMGRLAYLDSNEIDMVLELTERFQYYRLIDVNALLLQAFRSIPQTRLNNAPRILFAPLKSPYYKKEEKKIYKRRKAEGWTPSLLATESKSCDTIFRIMQIDYPSQYMQYATKIEICNTPLEVERNFVDGSLIILWDDFVGTGDSAFSAIAGLQHFLVRNSKNTQGGDYIVICMCAMQSGVNDLHYFDIDCYAANTLTKAISDDASYTLEEREHRKEAMKAVEAKVVKKALKNYSLGYCQSEALLSIMDKCPNNTFPFYWFKSQYNLAPVFYRQK